jgi:hypothetical protein
MQLTLNMTGLVPLIQMSPQGKLQSLSICRFQQATVGLPALTCMQVTLNVTGDGPHHAPLAGEPGKEATGTVNTLLSHPICVAHPDLHAGDAEHNW